MLKSAKPSDRLERQRISSYALISVANRVASKYSSFADAIELLNELSRVKADIDMSCSHELCIAEVTSRLLLRAQQFTDEMTIPGTEWPSTEEISQVMIEEALRLLNDEKQDPITSAIVRPRNHTSSP